MEVPRRPCMFPLAILCIIQNCASRIVQSGRLGQQTLELGRLVATSRPVAQPVYSKVASEWRGVRFQYEASVVAACQPYCAYLAIERRRLATGPAHVNHY